MWYDLLTVNKLVPLAIVGIVAVLLVIGIVVKRGGAPPQEESPLPAVVDTRPEGTRDRLPVATDGVSVPPAGAVPVSFGTPKKTAHFESSTPEHGATLPAPPINVTIDFNFDLVSNSAVTITKDGKEYGKGDTTISANKLSLQRALDQSAPDGLYIVTYKACWPDKTCHDGRFEFAIDRTAASAALDLRGRSHVTVNLKDITFRPQAIRISKGTTVKWQNDDDVEHYVNTDAHPSHTYFPPQNSPVLANGATYTTTFAAPGAYPYHCSAHASSMRGMIIVE